MRAIDPKHPFYAAAWRRYFIVLTCFIFAGLELYLGSPLWALLFGATGIYSFRVLIVRFGRTTTTDDNKDR